MKSRDAARSALTASWAAGEALILAGVPAYAALLVFAALAGTVTVLARHGATSIIAPVRKRAVRLLARTKTTGSTVERA